MHRGIEFHSTTKLKPLSVNSSTETLKFPSGRPALSNEILDEIFEVTSSQQFIILFLTYHPYRNSRCGVFYTTT